jgi:hypothetical protein
MRLYNVMEAPILSGAALDLYRAIVAGKPFTLIKSPTTAADLHLVAERLACDAAASELQSLWVDAMVVDSSQGDRGCAGAYVTASVAIYPEDGPVAVLDAAAASRVAQRLDEGLTLRQALDRTLAQCTPSLSRQTASRPTLRDGSRL